MSQKLESQVGSDQGTAIMTFRGMIEPKNDNFYFEPVQHLKMLNTYKYSFQVFNRFRIFKTLYMLNTYKCLNI